MFFEEMQSKMSEQNPSHHRAVRASYLHFLDTMLCTKHPMISNQLFYQERISDYSVFLQAEQTLTRR